MKFTLAQTKSDVSSRRLARGFAYALALPALLCAIQARAQDTITPTAPQPPPAVASPQTPRPGARPAPVAQPAARDVRPAAVVAPPSGAQMPPTPAAKAAPALAPMPPRQVVTVVHRLRGWKLLAWLATTVRPSFELDELPSPTDVHTNIVAGYISDDGRTVVARLPQAESDLDLPAPASNLFEPTPQAASPVAPKSEPEFTVITSDGRSVEAKFVGLDAATGLSLLETSSRLMSGAPVGIEGDTDDPTVGQRVRLYAPAPAPAARTAPAAPPASGYILVNIEEKEGLLSEVRSGTSGKPFRLVAQTPSASPALTGAVAANEIGDVIGIVSQTDEGGTQIVPVATVIGARERVMKLRGNAPQPWVGIGGNAAFREPLEEWRKYGWTPEAAMPHIQSGAGVLLTKVAPGAPAAVAGLKPGDLISRIGARDVRTVEDLSLTLKEAGVGSSLDFTVWRALEPEPLKFTVRLAATRNPAREFDEAQWRALAESGASDLVNALDAADSLRAFGLRGLRITQRGSARLGARGGLLVVAVRPGSYAADCGLRAGDVIETANGADFTPQNLRRVFANHDTEPVTLGVVRGGVRTNITYKSSEGSQP